jgi:ferredoxin
MAEFLQAFQGQDTMRSDQAHDRRQLLLRLGRSAMGLLTLPALGPIARLFGQAASPATTPRPAPPADPYVITGDCFKNLACVDVCPVDCIHPKPGEPRFAKAPQLYIDPMECIECSQCIDVCPVSAIFTAKKLPEKWKASKNKNADFYRR